MTAFAALGSGFPEKRWDVPGDLVVGLAICPKTPAVGAGDGAAALNGADEQL
jgi:hypothetical protein